MRSGTGSKQQWFKSFTIKDNDVEVLKVGLLRNITNSSSPNSNGTGNMSATITPSSAYADRRYTSGGQALTRHEFAKMYGETAAEKWANAPSAGSATLSTLDVEVLQSKVQYTAAVSVDNFKFQVSQDRSRRVGNGFSETVQFTDGSIQFEIRTAAASKFVSSVLQKLFMHLDLEVSGNVDDCRDVLAEIWGIVPMSKRTIGLLQPPDHDDHQAY